MPWCVIGQLHPGPISAGSGGIGLGNGQSFALRIVIFVHGNQRRHTKTPLVFFAYLGAWTLGGNHDHGDIRTYLHAFLDDIEAM